VNSEFHYPKYFAMLPSGPDTKPAFTEGFFQVASEQNPKPTTVAMAWADLEFSHNAAEGARINAKKYGYSFVYDKSYPPATTDFTPIVRAMQATNADLALICSYPLDSVGMVKAINELHAEDGWRRDGRTTGHHIQEPARSAAQRHREL
jgi:branched-chain amino acid transport system substrate-binding protein